MIKQIPIERILFLDIETVPQEESWQNLPTEEQNLWDKNLTSTQGRDNRRRFLSSKGRRNGRIWKNNLYFCRNDRPKRNA